MKGIISGRRPSPTIIVAILALVAGLTGVAVARPSAKKVTTKKVKKIADKEVNKLAPGLSVAHAGTADDSNTVGGHSAGCPGGTTLVRGYCFDTALRGPAASVFDASDDCRAQGGFLPTTMMIRSARNQLDLGAGPAPNSSYSDSTNGTNTIIVFSGGGVLSVSNATASKYHCVYPLLR